MTVISVMSAATSHEVARPRPPWASPRAGQNERPRIEDALRVVRDRRAGWGDPDIERRHDQKALTFSGEQVSVIRCPFPTEDDARSSGGNRTESAAPHGVATENSVYSPR